MIHEKRLLWRRIVVLLGALALSGLAIWNAVARPEGFLSDLLHLTHFEWDRPRIFGAFHLSMLAFCLLLAALIPIFLRRVSGERLDRVIFGAGILLFVLELYKQLYHWCVIGNGSYNFGILPFQFCSWALYVYLLLPLLPSGRIKEAFYDFCALYLTMGGCIVMGYPMLYREIPLCLHTMLWHSVMIAVGVLILSRRGYGRRYLREMLPSTLIFLGTLGLATVLNLILTPLTEGSAQPLNLFYMSPYEGNNYILISDVWERFGWLTALICYALLFVFVGATLMWVLGWMIELIRRKNYVKTEK